MGSRYDCSPVTDAQAVTWETVRCPLCDSERADPFLSAPADSADTRYHLVRCRECQLVYLNPRPTPESIAQFYPEDYEAYRPKGMGRGWRGRLRRRLEGLVLSAELGYPPPLRGWPERLLAWLAAPWFGPGRHSQTALPYAGRGRLLDYGCGS